jgi:hypothetical protein
MAEVYQKDPAYPLGSINSVLADGDQAELLVILPQLAQAFGAVQAPAGKEQLNPTPIDHTPSANGTPALSSFRAPNATSRKAIAQLESGKGLRFNSVAALMTKLNGDN